MPVPTVYRSLHGTTDGEFVTVGTQADYERVDVPMELAIRELVALDTRDRESVLEFVNAHGAITLSANDSDLIVPFRLDSTIEVPQGTVHWFDIALHLLEVQTLAKHFLAVKHGEPTVPIWQAVEVLVEDEGGAALCFIDALNNGLRRYSVRFEGEWSGVMVDGHEFAVQIEPRFDLYTALCLQIANLVIEDLDVHICPRCGANFTRQRDGAASGQYRLKGVTYCSRSCAKAQANRDYRKRKRANRKDTQ